MSTPEERLATLLHTVDVPVRGDGLARIQARLRRRRWTRWVVPVAALATAGAAASVIVLSGGTGRDTLTVQPAGTPAVPTPYSYPGPFIWPAPQSPTGAEAWRSDPRQVVERFVSDFLQLDGITVSPQATGARPGQGQEELLQVSGTAVAVVTVEPVDGGTSWVVTQAKGSGGQVVAPGFGETVSSPLAVRGTLERAVDDNVLLTLRTRSGKELAQTSAPAGSEVPWSGTLTWTDTSWTEGAVIGITRSNKDGAVTRVFAQPVVRATGA